VKIAIMQPYTLPYIGYLHLIHFVDKFIFLDDVSYINRGWINRNRITSVDGKSDYLFTIPLEGASQNRKINEISLHTNYPKWLSSFHKTFVSAYRKAPFFKEAEDLVFATLQSFKPGDLISDLAKRSIKSVFDYVHGVSFGNLGDRVWVTSSSQYGNQGLKKGARLIDICKQEGADHYINAIGGQELYTKPMFAEEGIKLSFVKSELKPYRQPFLPGLSIIDMIAYCDPETLHEQINSYHLL